MRRQVRSNRRKKRRLAQVVPRKWLAEGPYRRVAGVEQPHGFFASYPQRASRLCVALTQGRARIRVFLRLTIQQPENRRTTWLKAPSGTRAIAGTTATKMI